MKRLLLILLLFFTTTNVVILKCKENLNNNIITYYDSNGNQYNYNPIQEERNIYIEDSIYKIQQDSLLNESIKDL
jgi:hypothetical protein